MSVSALKDTPPWLTFFSFVLSNESQIFHVSENFNTNIDGLAYTGRTFPIHFFCLSGQFIRITSDSVRTYTAT